MQRLPVKYVGIILKTLINRDQFEKSKTKSLLDIIEDDGENATNKYTLVYDTVSPDGSMLFVPVFNDFDLDKTVERLESFGLGMRFTTFIATTLLCGNFCYRKFDNGHSIQQRILEGEYAFEKANRMNYEETGRKKKKETAKLDIRGARIYDQNQAEIS